MTPDVKFGETIINADGSRWVRVDVATDWRDPASEMVVSVTAVIPVKLAEGQLSSEVRAAAIDGFLSALRTVISQASTAGATLG